MLRPLSRVVRTWHPPAEHGDPLFAISAAWAAIVGGDIARHSTPVELAGGELTVATQSSAWSHQLSFLVPEIRRRLAERGIEPQIERIRFRVRFRAAAERAAAPAVPGLRAPPAEDGGPGEPIGRLRERIRAVRRLNFACDACAAPIAAEGVCGPCSGRAERARRTDAARLIFDMPWLGSDEIRALVPGLEAGAYDAVRRELLSRWWVALQRLKFARSPVPSAAERRIATSYVVLQSRVSPEAITPAIVRNLLGEELEKILFPA